MRVVSSDSENTTRAEVMALSTKTGPRGQNRFPAHDHILQGSPRSSLRRGTPGERLDFLPMKAISSVLPFLSVCYQPLTLLHKKAVLRSSRVSKQSFILTGEGIWWCSW